MVHRWSFGASELNIGSQKQQTPESTVNRIKNSQSPQLFPSPKRPSPKCHLWCNRIIHSHLQNFTFPHRLFPQGGEIIESSGHFLKCHLSSAHYNIIWCSSDVNHSWTLLYSTLIKFPSLPNLFPMLPLGNSLLNSIYYANQFIRRCISTRIHPALLNIHFSRHFHEQLPPKTSTLPERPSNWLTEYNLVIIISETAASSLAAFPHKFLHIPSHSDWRTPITTSIASPTYILPTNAFRASSFSSLLTCLVSSSSSTFEPLFLFIPH